MRLFAPKDNTMAITVAKTEELHKKAWTHAVVDLEQEITRFFKTTEELRSVDLTTRRVIAERLKEALLWAKADKLYDPSIFSAIERLALDLEKK